ncbi:hypothetical protein ABZS94_39095 [Streptomyces sp. NPDC005500]|uniref:hypothetical protein n=1 Tax=Streptomyces sp. NPDC005500 TaxID=3155007 RepID=UPI0033A67CB0
MLSGCRPDDPARLRYDDVTAAVEAFRTALKLDGEPHAHATQWPNLAEAALSSLTS